MRVRTASTTHQSNLENILQQFPYMTENIERIETHIRPPWWIPKIETRISATKDIAKELHYKMQEHTNATTASIYTDGSGIENKIGAAAYNYTTNEASHQHLGSQKQHNVYTGELTGDTTCNENDP